MKKKMIAGGATARNSQNDPLAQAGQSAATTPSSLEQIADWLIEHCPVTAKGVKAAFKGPGGEVRTEDFPGTIGDAKNGIMAHLRAGYRPNSGPFAPRAA